MKFTLKKLDLEKSLGSLKKSSFTAEALILAEFEQDKKKPKLSSLFSCIDKRLNGYLSDALREEEFEFKAAETLVIKLNSAERFNLDMPSTKKIILLGLGDEKDFKTKNERKAVAALVRKVKSEKLSSFAIKPVSDLSLFVETAILVDYEFTKYKTEAKKDKKELAEILVLSDTASQKEKDVINRAEIIANATCKARDLVWEPACVVTPSYLAKEAKKIKAENITVKVLEKADCEKLKMGSYLAVAAGSSEPPKFIEISYLPKGKIKKHIAIVGKGVTFDSGGLSLKPAKAMEMMKEDMSGAAATIAIMSALAELQPAGVQVTGIIAATENMPSGAAYKPGDVITAMNGKTIEVNNTDAEGRLTLADAVAYVSMKNPDEIIDIATLTGACITALGNVCAGLMTNNQPLLDRVKACADEQGERMWQLPLYDEYKEKLKSSIADLINAGSGGQAGAQNGGLFIREFIGKKAKSEEQIAWLHIDIAGPCWLEEAQDWSPKGASGIPVRTLLSYILSI